MTAASASRFSCELLEDRTFMSIAPAAAPVVHAAAQPATIVAKPAAAKPSAQSVANYMAGTWVYTIGKFMGTTMQYRQIWSAKGTYVIQVNFYQDRNGLPHQIAWTTLDSGTFKVMTESITNNAGNGMIYATSNFGANKGSLSIIYVRAASAKLVDMGVLPGNATANTKPVWAFWGRMV